MFAVKINSKGHCYEYTCPYCHQNARWANSFACPECDEYLSLYVEVIDSNVKERLSYHLSKLID